MSVRHIDTTRTTSLPVMDMADAIEMWGNELSIKNSDQVDQWRETTPQQEVPPPPLKAGERLSVYWTEHQEWYVGTFTSSHIEKSDDGGRQRASRVVYDATGLWAKCKAADLIYWHCLDDELWHRESMPN